MLYRMYGGRHLIAGVGVVLAALAPAVAGIETASASVHSPLAGAFNCDHVFVDADCIRAGASNISKKKGGVSVGGVHVTNGSKPTCPKFTEACLHLYQESNGLPGFQATHAEVIEYYTDRGLEPPDEPEAPDNGTDMYCAEVSVPTNDMTIASFTNHNTQGEAASHWELRTTDENEDTNTFTGSF